MMEIMETTPSEPYATDSAFSKFPPEIIESIAFFAAFLHQYDPPSTLISLFLVNSSFNKLLSPRSNSRLYANLFKDRYDFAAVKRRFGREGIVQMVELEECEGSGSRKKGDELTAKVLADEYVKRIVTMQRLKRLGTQGRISDVDRGIEAGVVVTSTMSAGEPQHEGKLKGKEALAGERVGGLILAASSVGADIEELRPIQRNSSQDSTVSDQITADLWLAYLMVLEHDEHNLPQLIHHANLQTFLSVYENEKFRTDIDSPGYPPETADRSLALHLGWYLTEPSTLENESLEQSSEKLFFLRPYVFAAHKFDAFYAPWTTKVLPALTRPPGEGLLEPNTPLAADFSQRLPSQSVTHIGKKLRLVPPMLSQAACFSFFHRIERDDAVSGAERSETLTGGPAGNRVQGAVTNPRFRHYQDLLPNHVSLKYDQDFMRLASCLDPQSSPGLPPYHFKGKFSGSWEGRFSFFDFDSYRDMLAGRMRSLYDGPFGDQPQVWKLEERLVRLDDGFHPGGYGPSLNAGFPVGDDVEFANVGGLNDGFSTKPGEEERAAKRNCDGELDPDGRYEIILTGSGHSAWGQFVLRGRIRSWDGMFTLTKEYTPDGRGRWLYRGYIVGGDTLIGRWRDTFTPENLSGYEGCFTFSRRS